MTRRGMMGLLVAGAALGLVGCWPLYPSAKLRYRMTVEVETPRGVRTGMSVIESTIHDGPGWGDTSGISYSMHGEAVAVDLPGGRTLFALLDKPGGSDPAGYHAHLFNETLASGIRATPPMPRLFSAPEWNEERRTARRLRPSLTLPPARYPLLVTFADIDDPKSVERVDPADLTAMFGPGVRLKAITIAVTDEPITTGIEKQLGWLKRSEDGGLDTALGVTAHPTLAQQLSFLDFRRN